MPIIETISTGVPGLDRVLGGGLPTHSFNVIRGDPGAGKTTLAHQIIFANATEQRPALFCTVVGEPPIKMLRYQQQFDFFDPEKVGTAIHFQNLTDEAVNGDLEATLDGIMTEVERLEPALVVVDSFSSMSDATRQDSPWGPHSLQSFVQRLSIEMTRWEATTFLLGEFETGESHPSVFTVADGILSLRHSASTADRRVRKLEVVKLRGAAELPGQHIYRISRRGLRIYTRELSHLPDIDTGEQDTSSRLSTGVEGLDEMMMGGLVPGDSAIVSGPSGTGKSVLGIQFMAAGLEAGESVVVAIFEESARRFLSRIAFMGVDAEEAKAEDRLRILNRRPLDLAVDETLEELRDLVEEIGATRLVIDSISGLEVMASGTDSQRLRESLGRFVLALTDAGVTILMTVESDQHMEVPHFTPHQTSFLTDDLILQRYVEVRGQLETVLSVVKMRRSPHDRTFHRYSITDHGIVLGDALEDLHGILTGVPETTGESSRSQIERNVQDDSKARRDTKAAGTSEGEEE